MLAHNSLALPVDYIMPARPSWSLQYALTPLSNPWNRQRLNRSTVSKAFYTSIMQPKVSEGQDTRKVIAETNVLLGKGWALDDEEMGIKRTFYFKTYTKALVRSAFQALQL